MPRLVSLAFLAFYPLKFWIRASVFLSLTPSPLLAEYPSSFFYSGDRGCATFPPLFSFRARTQLPILCSDTFLPSTDRRRGMPQGEWKGGGGGGERGAKEKRTLSRKRERERRRKKEKEAVSGSREKWAMSSKNKELEVLEIRFERKALAWHSDHKSRCSCWYVIRIVGESLSFLVLSLAHQSTVSPLVDLERRKMLHH